MRTSTSRFSILAFFFAGFSIQAPAVDLYGAAPSAQSAALGGLFSGSGSGPTDSLAANPAALSFVRRPTLEFSGAGAFASGSYRNSTPNPGSLQSSSNFAGSAAFGMRLGHSPISVGAGIFPVSMLSGTWRFTDPVGVGGASYGVQTNKSAFVAMQSTTAVSWQVNKQVSLGVGFGILYNRNTLMSPYIFQNNALAGLKTLLDLHTAGTGYNGTFGAIYAPHKRVEFGATYKTRTLVKSTGTANGDVGVQLDVLGLPAQRTFRYDARVDNVFPQSAALYTRWQATQRLRAHLQGDWVNWHGAFIDLPVRLTKGTNADINGLLGSTSLNDSIALRWRNQLTWRGGVDYAVTEGTKVYGGYSHSNNPVPAGTLTPMTANIMQNGLATGLTTDRGHFRFGAAYQVNLPAEQTVGKSSLTGGEFSNSRTRLWLQTVMLTTGIRF